MNLIDKVEKVKDLGITLSSNCNFNQHINNVYKQCSRLSGWILRAFISRDSLTLLTLFKCSVLSRLDYGSQLWSPHQTKSINNIEQVQRSFSRFITGMRLYLIFGSSLIIQFYIIHTNAKYQYPRISILILRIVCDIDDTFASDKIYKIYLSIIV